VAATFDNDDDLHTAAREDWLPEIPRKAVTDSYRLSDRILGKGGSSRVILAEKYDLPQQVAIKRLLAEHVLSESGQRRFIREVRLQATLQHRNIVRVENWGCDAEGLYIVMEWMRGGSLQDYVTRHGALDLEMTVRMARQTCRALEFAHTHNVVHRDLKPANLLLDGQLQLKLADFGLARAHDQLIAAAAAQHTGGQEQHTFAYAAPEQLLAGGVVDLRSDLFSLGATLFHLATGQVPRDRNYPLDKVPVPLQPILQALLQSNPDARPATATVVLRLLDEQFPGRPGTAGTGPAGGFYSPLRSRPIYADSLRPPARLSALRLTLRKQDDGPQPQLLQLIAGAELWMGRSRTWSWSERAADTLPNDYVIRAAGGADEEMHISRVHGVFRRTSAGLVYSNLSGNGTELETADEQPQQLTPESGDVPIGQSGRLTPGRAIVKNVSTMVQFRYRSVALPDWVPAQNPATASAAARRDERKEIPQKQTQQSVRHDAADAVELTRTDGVPDTVLYMQQYALVGDDPEQAGLCLSAGKKGDCDAVICCREEAFWISPLSDQSLVLLDRVRLKAGAYHQILPGSELQIGNHLWLVCRNWEQHIVACSCCGR
jgi:serine/threonine protein kinase